MFRIWDWLCAAGAHPMIIIIDIYSNTLFQKICLYFDLQLFGLLFS